MYELITLNNQFLNLDVLDEENEILKQTGFSGSNATFLKGKNKSYLFTDRRYELQAKKEIKDKSIEVVFEKFQTWLFANDIKDKIYYNPWCHSVEEVNFFGKNFVAKAKEPDYLIDREPFEYETQYAGEPACNKVLEIVEKLEAKKLDAYIITDATDVSWMLNLRSGVLPYSPVFRAFAIVNKNGVVQLFNHPKQMRKYKTVGFADTKTPAIFLKYIKDYKCPHFPLGHERWRKSELEIQGFKNAHIKDGVAITKLLYWIYNTKTSKTELEIANKLHKLRLEQNGFYKESFASIVASAQNSALPHYQPCEKKSDKIAKDILLIDVGAHYFGGTTDMTRTIHMGKPTSEQIKHFTLALKGHIELACQRFPLGTTGQQIDILARRHLLNEGLDYRHGTGHGVGNFLCVHEGPFISQRNPSTITENIVTSIEPGVYFEGEYGIRIENLYRTKLEKNGMLAFENLTFVPLDMSLINFELLSEAEASFVKEYQKEVYKKIGKFLNSKEKEWLKSYL